MRATLVITSTTAPLEMLESRLGESSHKSHSLGSSRKSGLPYKQTVWMRDWVSASDVEDHAVSNALAWLQENQHSLTDVDPAPLLKIVGSIDPGEALAISPSMSSILASLRVLVLIENSRAGPNNSFKPSPLRGLGRAP